MNELVPAGYADLLSALKERIKSAQIRAALAVNSELIRLYWSIGREILERQQAEGWGAKVIERLARDLQVAFPKMQGLSPRNLKYMRSFAEAWGDDEIVQRVVAQLPWGQNISLIEKIKDNPTRLWYAQKAVQNGWSHAILEHQI